MQEEPAATPIQPYVRADVGIRIAGYLIDVLPMMLVGFISLIPVLGVMLFGLVLVPYWLFHDIFGGSLGKHLLGMKIVSRDGTPASTGACILRNLTLVLGPAFLLIPLIGPFLATPIAGICVLVESIMLLSQGQRLGDRWAGTVVVKEAR